MIKRIRHELGMAKYRWRLRQWAKLTAPEVVVRSKQGTFLVSTKDKVISRALYAAGRFEYEDMHTVVGFLRREGLLKPESLMLDVGANIGPIAIGMIHLGFAGRAIAIEPEPDNFRRLRLNVDRNRMDQRIICVHAAASDRTGTLLMALHPNNHGDHRVTETASGPTVSVPSRRLDDIVADATDDVPGLIWMDIQGHEAFALRGAPTLLKLGVPLYVEIWPEGINGWGGGLPGFIDIAREHWRHVVEFDDTGETRQPVAKLAEIADRIGSSGTGYGNVLLIR